MNRIAIYARKSSESEDRQILSIESQINELNSYAHKMGWQISRIYTESKSAKAPGREVFKTMCREIQKGNIRELLCWKLDRLARNPVDGGTLIWGMEEHKLLHIHTPQRSFNNCGNDKFWLQLEFGMAKKYVDDLSDNVKRGLKARAEKGWYPSQAPLGYLNDRAHGTIIKDPDRFPLVKQVWDLLLTGVYTPYRIVKIANSEFGLRTRPYKSGGSFPVCISSIYMILSNPFYYGVFKYNGTIYPGKHPPMITRKQFEQAQEILTCDHTTRPQKYEFAYSGLIKCGECGASITAEHKTNRFGSKYIYYHCTRRKKHVVCSQPCVEEKALDKQVMAFLDTISIDQDVLNLVMTILDREKDTIRDEQQMFATNLQKQLTDAEKNLSELLNIKLRGLLSDEEFTAKRNELEAQKQRLADHLEKVRSNIDGHVRQTVEAFEYASKVKTVFERGALTDKKAVLRYVGSNPVLYNKTLSIMAAKPFEFMQTPPNLQTQKRGRFEPRNLRSDYIQAGRKTDISHSWLGVVEDVRTFFLKSSGYPQSDGT
jgi:site-specific DNA recombinase